MRKWRRRISAVFCLISPQRNHYSRPNSVSSCSCGWALNLQSFKAPIFSLVLIWQQPPLIRNLCNRNRRVLNNWLSMKDTAINMHYWKRGLIFFCYFARAKTCQCSINSNALSKLHSPLIFEGKSYQYAANCCHISVVVWSVRYFKVLPLNFCRQIMHHVSYSNKLNQRVKGRKWKLDLLWFKQILQCINIQLTVVG